MKLFSDFKSNRQENKRKNLTSLAKNKIGIEDFEDKLYIAFDGVPVVQIESSQSPEQIVEKLKVFRENFVKGKMAESRVRSVVF